MRGRRFANLLLLPGMLWLVLLFLVPLAVVVAVSLATTDLLGRPVYGLYFGNYHQVLQGLYVPVFLRSLLYAFVTTLICLLLGYPTAYTVARYGGRYRNLLILLVIIPWFVDYLVRIYSWIQLLGTGGLISSLAGLLGFSGASSAGLLGNVYAVLAGLVYNYLPFMVLPIYVAVEQMDPALIDAAKDLYARPRAAFWYVTLRRTLPGVTAGCLLVFLPTIGDFATAQLLGSPNQYMIGNLISTELQITGATPLGAGLTVLLIALLVVIIAGYFVITRGRAGNPLGGIG